MSNYKVGDIIYRLVTPPTLSEAQDAMSYIPENTADQQPNPKNLPTVGQIVTLLANKFQFIDLQGKVLEVSMLKKPVALQASIKKIEAAELSTATEQPQNVVLTDKGYPEVYYFFVEATLETDAKPSHLRNKFINDPGFSAWVTGTQFTILYAITPKTPRHAQNTKAQIVYAEFPDGQIYTAIEPESNIFSNAFLKRILEHLDN